MTVRVLCFGVVKDILGDASLTFEGQDGADVAALLAQLMEHHQGLAKLHGSLAIAVNQHYVNREYKLNGGDEVALLPPVSGGNHASATKVALTREPIPPAALRGCIPLAEDGAVCTFAGIVRNHSHGRATLYLDYEAYEEMALNQMRELAQRAQADFDIHGVILLHRLGRLQIGETSVLASVSAPHRDAAFQACRWLIDTLKTTVPIWKKEHFADGAAWATGEPFPAAVLR